MVQDADSDLDLGTDIHSKNGYSNDRRSGSRLESESSFCTVQCSYLVWSPNLSRYPSPCKAM